MKLLIMLATITVTAPLTNEDGSPLDDLANVCFYLLSGTQVQCMPATPGEELSMQYPINVILERKCFYATAQDLAGNESVPSNTACSTRWRCYSCHERLN